MDQYTNHMWLTPFQLLGSEAKASTYVKSLYPERSPSANIGIYCPHVLLAKRKKSYPLRMIQNKSTFTSWVVNKEVEKTPQIDAIASFSSSVGCVYVDNHLTTIFHHNSNLNIDYHGLNPVAVGVSVHKSTKHVLETRTGQCVRIIPFCVTVSLKKFMQSNGWYQPVLSLPIS